MRRPFQQPIPDNLKPFPLVERIYGQFTHIDDQDPNVQYGTVGSFIVPSRETQIYDPSKLKLKSVYGKLSPTAPKFTKNLSEKSNHFYHKILQPKIGQKLPKFYRVQIIGHSVEYPLGYIDNYNCEYPQAGIRELDAYQGTSLYNFLHHVFTHEHFKNKKNLDKLIPFLDPTAEVVIKRSIEFDVDNEILQEFAGKTRRCKTRINTDKFFDKYEDYVIPYKVDHPETEVHIYLRRSCNKCGETNLFSYEEYFLNDLADPKHNCSFSLAPLHQILDLKYIDSKKFRDEQNYGIRHFQSEWIAEVWEIEHDIMFDTDRDADHSNYQNLRFENLNEDAEFEVREYRNLANRVNLVRDWITILLSLPYDVVDLMVATPRHQCSQTLIRLSQVFGFMHRESGGN